jgi:glycosyltransferase involved in cell wall biosynthesis
MKILHAGNMANFAYLLVKKLRSDGIDSELLMNKNPHPSSDPTQYDPYLKENKPNWIKYYDLSKKMWPLHIMLSMWKKYDLIHCYVELPIFAYFTNRKFITTAQGSDLSRLAFSNTLKGFLLRRAYKKAKVIVCPTVGCFPLLSKLNLQNGVFIPSIIDLKKFSPNPKPSLNDRFTIFHPTSQIWNIKGNDKLIYGFKKFIEKYPKSNLIIVDHNIDSKKTKMLVQELDLEKFISFVKGPLNVDDLKKYYDVADVVADQFLATDLGGIGREVLSMKKPLLTSCWVSKYKEVFGSSPPIANASTSEEIAAQLELLTDLNFRQKIAEDGYIWINKNFNPDIISKKIQLLYQKIIDGEQIPNIQKSLTNMGDMNNNE